MSATIQTLQAAGRELTRILVLDDEEIVHQSVERVLERSGMEIVRAHTAEEAFERMTVTRFDTLISDVRLPTMSGMEFLRHLRNEGNAIPAIMITGYASFSNAVSAASLGAVEYLPKPFTRFELSRALSKALERGLPPEDPGRSHGGNDVALDLESRKRRLPWHTWALLVDQMALIGLDPPLVRRLGKLESLSVPGEGERIEQGRACIFPVSVTGYSPGIRSPLTGRVVGVNPNVRQDLDAVLSNPAGIDWLIEVEPLCARHEMRNLEPV